MQQVTVSDVLHPSFCRDVDDKFLLGRILNIKRSDKLPLPFHHTKGLGGNAKRKYQNDANYDRIITVAELNSKTAFVIITRTAQESARLLHNVNDNLFIGCIVQVVEPVFSNRFLGTDTSNPILEVDVPLVPQPNEVDVRVNVVDDGHSSGTFHFSLPPMRLRFTKAMLSHPTCSGLLCDRKSLKSSCCCVETEAQSGFAISLRMMADEDVDDNHPLQYGEHIQSFSLSKLFIATPTFMCLPSNIPQPDLRAAVRRVQDHVNVNGGFHVSGWYKCGTSQEDTVNRVSEYHIVRVRPACVIPDNLKLSMVNRVVVPNPIPNQNQNPNPNPNPNPNANPNPDGANVHQD